MEVDARWLAPLRFATPTDVRPEAFFTMSEPGNLPTIADPLIVRKPKVRRQPRYHVILWDDDDHSYEYVIVMMKKLFAYSLEKGYEIAKTVDSQGRAICLTTTLEHAELKRDQIHAYGSDPLIESCQGSMSATIEPADD